MKKGGVPALTIAIDKIFSAAKDREGCFIIKSSDTCKDITVCPAVAPYCALPLMCTINKKLKVPCDPLCPAPPAVDPAKPADATKPVNFKI